MSLALAWYWAASLHQLPPRGAGVQEQAETASTLATAQGFPLCGGWGTILRGWALAAQGQGEEGLAQMQQGLAA